MLFGKVYHNIGYLMKFPGSIPAFPAYQYIQVLYMELMLLS
jgi:hypothetical protein